MRPLKSLVSAVTLSLVVSVAAQAEEIIPPFGSEVPAAQGAVSYFKGQAVQLMMQTNLFIRKNHLGNPQMPDSIYPQYRQAFNDVRAAQTYATTLEGAIPAGGASAVQAYQNVIAVFLSLNQSIRSMKNSGLMNASDVGQAFDHTRDGLDAIRQYFVSRWKNKAGVSSAAYTLSAALQSASDRLEQTLSTLPQVVPPAPGVPAPFDPTPRTRVVIAQLQATLADAARVQEGIMLSPRDPNSPYIQTAVANVQESLRLARTLAERPGTVTGSVQEVANVEQSLGQFSYIYQAELAH